MKTPVFFTGSSSTNLSTGATRYSSLAGSGSSAVSFVTSLATAAVRMPIDCTVSTLRALFPTALSQGSYTVTLMKGATTGGMVATALTVTITTSGITASDLANSVSVTAGEYVCWRFEPTGTPTAQTNSIQLGFVIDAVTPGESVIFATSIAGTAAGFVGPGGSTTATGSELLNTGVVPCAGTISNLYVYLGALPGGATARAVTLRQGTAIGGLSSTALTVSLGAADRTMADTTNSVSVAAGDLITFGHTVTGTPASSAIMIAVKFVPANSGETPLFGMSGSLSNSATRYVQTSGNNGTAESTENNVAQIIPAAGTFKSLRHDAQGSPGSGRTRTMTLRKNAADTGLSVQLTNTDLTGTDTEDVAVAGGDLVNVASTVSGTPAASTWNGNSSVLVLDTGPAPVSFSPGGISGDYFEGIRNTPQVLAAGAYSGTPTDVQVRLVDGSAAAVTSWTSATTQTGGAYSHTFTGVPVGGPYYQQVRDNGGSATASVIDIYVGGIVFFNGQSQSERLYSSDVGGLAPTTGMTCHVMTYSSYNNVSSASRTITKLIPSTSNLGSGVVAIANQWHADTGGTVPLLIVCCSYQGTSIEYWVEDRKGDYPTNADVTTLWGSSPTTGLAWFMAAGARYQASAIYWKQGTSDISPYPNVAGAGGYTYETALGLLKAKWDALCNALPNPPLFIIEPFQRSNETLNFFEMRQTQYSKGISGGNYRAGPWLLDWQCDGNGSKHQATGATGNIRGGTRIGRGLAKLLHNSGLDIAGPAVSTVKFTDTNRNVIEITFGANISLADGTAFAGSPVTILPELFSISVNSGSTFGNPGVGFTAAMTAANKVQLTKSSGSWAQSTTRIDYLRGTPFSSNVAATDYIGAEAGLEASHLSKVITDTSSFDSNRGMPLAPFMGTGTNVAEASGGGGGGTAQRRPSMGLGMGLGL